MITYEDISLMSSICTDWMETIEHEHVPDLTGLSWDDLIVRLRQIDLEVKKHTGVAHGNLKVDINTYDGMMTHLSTIMGGTGNVQAPLMVIAKSLAMIGIELNEMNRKGESE